MEIQRAELSDDQDCFYNDEGINQMRIQVVDIAPYHGHEKKLSDDINEVNRFKENILI